jgi:hypothetical protein
MGNWELPVQVVFANVTLGYRLDCSRLGDRSGWLANVVAFQAL